MKKYVIITIILLAATAYVTVVYFKNLNPPGARTSQVMHLIPDDACAIFEFNNDKGFYDIFKGSKLFASVIGAEKMGQLDTLRQALLQNPALSEFFSGQNIYISLHTLKNEGFGLLITMSAGIGFDPNIFSGLTKQPHSGLLIKPITEAGKSGYNIFVGALKKSFYLIDKGDNIFSGSFSKELIDQSASHQNKKGEKNFIQLPEQQRNNSLANLYLNYNRLTPLFDRLFKNRNTDIFRNFKLLNALAALSLNYRTDAIMFNGSTDVNTGGQLSYLNLFTDLKPVDTHLDEIFPSTTAYCTAFSVSDPKKFGARLTHLQNKNGTSAERDQLFGKIKAETAVDVRSEFNNLLGNEFAIVTTRYFEKFAIIAVNDGSKLKLAIAALSTMNDENTGQFNYENLLLYLLGDAFGAFRKPYFMIIDNYMILANSSTELTSYYDTYINRKFLSKNDQYKQFQNLLAAQSNVSFFFNFRNAQPIFERDMDGDIYSDFKRFEPGWKNFYGASFQFTSVDNNFYTNFSMMLNTDTTTTK
ncbi:MAG TPA: hypothetical protein VHA56_13590 [Mucilaginibacter sp.]|nr:hypothetical protein [Mucilaginibacter sp.]